MCKGDALVLLTLMIVQAFQGLLQDAAFAGQSQRGGRAMAFELRSPAFQPDQSIPRKYTCDGPDVSVPLRWTDPPPGTKSFALIADDPDAPMGTWVHWVLYDLPAETRELPEGLPSQERLPNGAKQGLNDFRRVGYGGPCPPPGPAHRYFFKLYALDSPTNLKPRATKQQLLDAMKGHILAEAQLIGRYQR
ncbi:MAG: YbhB/YbcL family Raf kinase inhibitor-like protein [Candidatus Methylomirabilales bacterium]